MDECKYLVSAAWMTALQEGGVSAGFAHSCPGAQNHAKLQTASPRTPEGNTSWPSAGM